MKGSNPNSMNQCFGSVGTQDLDPQHSPAANQSQRRLRGFAATNSNPNSNKSSSRKEREKEKERTKLRERHRRAITSRMLAGLRQYGNFPLPARADMNDVIAALAREAGWTVEPDGTTYKQSQSQPHFNSIQLNNANASNLVSRSVFQTIPSPDQLFY